MICFVKAQSENMKMTWNIRLFIFGIICNFSNLNKGWLFIGVLIGISLYLYVFIEQPFIV